jgi:hypothetical protein
MTPDAWGAAGRTRCDHSVTLQTATCGDRHHGDAVNAAIVPAVAHNGTSGIGD